MIMHTQTQFDPKMFSESEGILFTQNWTQADKQTDKMIPVVPPPLHLVTSVVH